MENSQNKQMLLEQALLESNDLVLKDLIEEMPTPEVIDFLCKFSIEEQIEILKTTSNEIKGKIFSDFDQETLYKFFNTMERFKFSRLFTFMSSDIRADFYRELSKQEQIEIIPYLDKKIREDVIVLSAYPPETAGGIMNTDFATVGSHMSAERAIAKIRKDAPSQKMIYYIYVVDRNMKLLGMVTIKDLIMSEPEQLVEEFYQEFIVFADVNEDRESVAQKIEKYDLVAIPILNSLNQLVGIVSHEEAIDIIRAEHTEDMEKFMGIVPSEDEVSYLSTSPIEHFKRRVIWIVCLAAIGLISGIIVHHYQHALEKMIILALYMPMMAATGGNSGSQAATVVIRAMALGQVESKDWFRIILKESIISFLLSICVGLLIFIKISFFSHAMNIPDGFSAYYIGFLISLAIAMQIVTSAIIGAGLPILVKRFGGDPAVAASPAITTVVDITGLLIYFGIASVALNI